VAVYDLARVLARSTKAIASGNIFRDNPYGAINFPQSKDAVGFLSAQSTMLEIFTENALKPDQLHRRLVPKLIG
jgi:hypothetical protein